MTQRIRLLGRLLLLLLLVLPVACNEDEDEVSSETFLRYGALGASDAVGVGANPLENGYVWLIQDYLETRADNVPLRNAGIPGATSDVILALELPFIVDHSPNVVTLWTGANDITKGRDPVDFDADLDEMLFELRTETPASIYVGNIPDLTLLPKYQGNPDPNVTRARVDAFNAVIHSRVAMHGAHLVDLFSTPLAEDPRYVSGDGFHPNNEGYRLMADTYISAMSATLPQAVVVPTPRLRFESPVSPR